MNEVLAYAAAGIITVLGGAFVLAGGTRRRSGKHVIGGGWANSERKTAGLINAPLLIWFATWATVGIFLLGAVVIASTR